MTSAHPADGGEACGHGRMRAEARREQLIRVAIELFSEKGFSGTTTKEIAHAAGVTEALIFRHFPTKEALYEAILRWRVEQSCMEEKMAELREIADRRDDALLFRSVVGGILEFHSENVDFLRLMLFAMLEEHTLAQSFRERHIQQIYDFLTDYVETRQREGAFADVDAKAAVRAILGMPFYHSLVNHIFHCSVHEIEVDAAVDSFVHIALEGLRRPKTADSKEET